MSTTALGAPTLAAAPSIRWRRFVAPAAAIVAVAAAGMIVGHKPPSWLDLHVVRTFDRLYKWTVTNRQSSILFTAFLNPIASALRSITDATTSLLRTLRYPGVLALTALIGYRTGGRPAAIAGTAALAGCGVLGLWDDTMITMALMIVSVAVSLVIGIPLGIWAGRSDRADRAMRSFLDAAQVLPAFVYLLPAVVFFGIGNAAAIVATVIFAVAPAVRLTSHGLRSVPVVANEVGRSFGCTRGQLLRKVQLPLSRRAMLLGLNQVIMMAFGIAVIASMIGVAGLGNGVLVGLQDIDVGQAFVPGLAIVLAAIALDRITTGTRPHALAHPPPAWRFARRWTRAGWVDKLTNTPARTTISAVAGVAAAAAVGALANVHELPSWLTVNLKSPVNDLVDWLNNHIRRGVPVVGGTSSINDFLVRDILNPMKDWMVSLPWWLVIAAIVAIAWASGGRRLALVCGACGVGIGALRVWDLAMQTLSQVLVAVALSVAIAVPIGIIAGRSDRFERALRPLLDAAQVMPPFVYLVPVIFLFDVGVVPGVIASVIYAVPPGIRLTSLGLRQVPTAPREAAVSFGATSRQELVKVQLPLAARSVMLGINQTIIMVLSMVVVAALIGAEGLGLETVYGLRRQEIGKGVAGGVAIVLLAIVLDRITQAWGTARSGPQR